MLTAEDRTAIAQIVEAAVAKAMEPILARLDDEEDDEPFGPETLASIEESRAEIAAGAPMLTSDELRAKLGLAR